MAINHRIRLLISELGFTQENFGKEIVVTRITVSNWLTNKIEVDARHILKILDLNHNISAEWLIRGNGNMFLDKENVNQVNEPASDYTNHLQEKINLLTELNTQKDVTIKLYEKLTNKNDNEDIEVMYLSHSDASQESKHKN